MLKRAVEQCMQSKRGLGSLATDLIRMTISPPNDRVDLVAILSLTHRCDDVLDTVLNVALPLIPTFNTSLIITAETRTELLTPGKKTMGHVPVERGPIISPFPRIPSDICAGNALEREGRLVEFEIRPTAI